MPVIECTDVWKTFRMHKGSRLLRERVKQVMRRPSGPREFTALRGITFSVDEGESVAIVGKNGAGKSTLLSMISGLSIPNRGSMKVSGRVAPLLELGAGFHPDLTGRENLLLNAALMGFTEQDVEDKIESIIEFSGIVDFIDEPLRTYSSGMNMRLAFSIATNVDPEILIVDEILAVGDQSFTQKCLRRVMEIREKGRTFICVSHSLPFLKTLCDRGIWLDGGELMMQGPITDVLDAYAGSIPRQRAAGVI